jgi:hypothetical protein
MPATMIAVRNIQNPNAPKPAVPLLIGVSCSCGRYLERR